MDREQNFAVFIDNTGDFYQVIRTNDNSSPPSVRVVYEEKCGLGGIYDNMLLSAHQANRFLADISDSFEKRPGR